MAVTRFEGGGPVARYWLAHCEGFAVKGGARGVVEELLHDVNPHLTSRLLVRTRRGRMRVIPVSAVETVLPAERTLVVHERRRKPKAKATKQKTSSRRVRRAASRTSAAVRSRVRSAANAIRPQVRGGAVAVWPLVHATVVVLGGSFRQLATELRATARGLLRSAQPRTLRLPRRPRKKP
ncbi:MAG TPA: hypothetical protein VGH82_01990 [Gaiellaceae bacterium]|jgi:hypothetical protein